MKHTKVHMPNISYIAAFVMGVILFAVFWKILFGSASSTVVLAGMAGVTVTVAASWIYNEIRRGNRKEQ